MCNFISTIKSGNEHFYLTKNDLKGKKFKEFKEYNKSFWQEEICGHGAINFFYPDVTGEHWECEDFSSQKNFPSCVVEDIKKGNFRGIGICIDILNNEGKKKYKKIKQSAWEEYNKVEQPALAEYNKIKQSASTEYKKITQSAFWDIATQRKFRNKNWK